MADGGGNDRLSALPEDVLRLILLHLRSAAAAAQTSLLSRHWRNIWTTLPELRFADVTDLTRVSTVLRDHAAPVLRKLHVLHELPVANDGAPDKIAAVLDVAAPLLEGELCFDIIAPANQNLAAEAAGIGGAFQIPCFEKATEITMSLRDLLGIRLPPAGVFAKLAALRLNNFRFDNQNQRDLGAAVSSEGCPLLRELRLCNSLGLSNLAISSESLLHVHLSQLGGGLQQLTIFAPMLRDLHVSHCFNWRKPTAEISAPALRSLNWIDKYDQSSVHFGVMPHLQSINTSIILAYGRPNFQGNRDIVEFLKYFKAVRSLGLLIFYPASMVNREYLINTISMLPDDIEILCLLFATRGHTFGPCAFHFLRMSTSIRELKLFFDDRLEAEVPCSSGCICYKPQDWETMDISLSFLEKVEINRMTGAECEICFVKRLLTWTPVLKTITLNFHPSVTVSEELCKELPSLSSPGVCMEIYLHRNGVKVMYRAVNLEPPRDN